MPNLTVSTTQNARRAKKEENLRWERSITCIYFNCFILQTIRSNFWDTTRRENFKSFHFDNIHWCRPCCLVDELWWVIKYHQLLDSFLRSNEAESKKSNTTRPTSGVARKDHIAVNRRYSTRNSSMFWAALPCVILTQKSFVLVLRNVYCSKMTCWRHTCNFYCDELYTV